MESAKGIGAILKVRNIKSIAHHPLKFFVSFSLIMKISYRKSKKV
jgi:hypothetical protein